MGGCSRGEVSKLKENKSIFGGNVRFLQLIATAFVLYGGYKLLRFLWVKLMIWILKLQSALSVSEAASIGIIGGADGPTAIFVTAPDHPSFAIPVLLLLVGAAMLMLIRKKKQNR
jgi:Na+-transporting methylmalonyl-CoA/oxaloacetate decarboxylase beta subunit